MGAIYAFAFSGVVKAAATRPLAIPMIGTSIFSGIITVAVMVTALKRLIFQHGRALWIENGRVVFLHKWNISAVCADIADISTGTYGRYDAPGILLRMRDGTDTVIPTRWLAEPPAVIIDRLNRYALARR